MMMLLKFVAPRIAGQMLGYIQRYPLVMTFIAGLTLGAGGIGYFWWTQPTCEEKAAVAALELERKARINAEEIVSDRTRTIERLRADLQVLREQAASVVPDRPECDLSPDVTRLLNSARKR